jgi:spore coat protein YutH
LRDLLRTFYATQISEEIVVEEKVGFKSGNSFYFTILATNNKVIHMEQASLAYYLVENGYYQIAHPIPNIHGDWITSYHDARYMVLKVTQLNENIRVNHGKLLAQFHQTNNAYGFEPKHISSYGQWKMLWIDKLTSFEAKIIEEAKENNNDYYRLLINILPYIIGISENAIQYMQESEQEYRYDHSDQGTISFQRYHDQLLCPVVWHTDLVYDHLTRDLAEFIRFKFLQNGEQAFTEVMLFLKEYQSIHPLSVFSWRLLFARLIYPAHMLDLIEHAFLTQNYERHVLQLQEVLEKQSDYERCLGCFFQRLEVNYNELQIPMLQWL